MKKLALGVKSFEEIRDAKNDFVYVDKTKYIVEFAEGCRVIVFSRPPHFGKTLLVSTLENLFSGKKELFKGLYIYDKWNWQKTYPVIKIDFSDAQITTRESLEKFLSNLMSSIAKENGITLISGSSGMKFSELIQRLSEIKKQKVVILVDDCDNALWSNLKNPEDLEAVQMALGRFFQIVKSCDADIHFVLIMNVLKIIFSGIFSGFNNYTDETLDEKFSAICGYTQEELEKYFKDYIGALAKNYSWSKEKTLEAIKFWYGGYSWDGKT
ncbi:MAG: AAA family ATPase, partial [Elusimicrobiota bacterium]|nr:AAA family ATPase [Elusimicrobiota bacterium]